MPPFLRKLFGKKPAAPEAPVVSPSVAAPSTSVRSPSRNSDPVVSSMQVPQVAVARLSLLPILQKLPEDLRANIIKYPEGDATVALPLTTIQKQLAAGSVKMSLASLYRQAPHGTFSQDRVEEKRMIDVPLAEVLRHVKPESIRRRADQRRIEIPHNAPALFGDRTNRFAVKPSSLEDFAAPDLEPKFSLDDLPAANGGHVEAAAPLRMPSIPLAPARIQISAEPEAAPATTAPAPPQGNISVPLSKVYAGWPEPLFSEAASAPDAMLEVPAALLAPCLAKGKAIFSWKQLRRWIQPPLNGDTAEQDDLEIALPLKVMAPAFLAHTGPRTRKIQVELDPEIPALFNGVETPSEKPEAVPSVQALAQIPEPPTEEAITPEPAFAPAPEPEPVAVAPLKFQLAEEQPAPSESRSSVEVTAIIDAPTVEADSSPAPVVASVAEELAAAFNLPGKAEWSPQELIDGITSQPGVAGAIIALKEGLVVASRLPDHMKGDTVAAFLPQIFGRLNTYSQEMSLGDIDEVLLNASGAHLQGYRIGEVYFAVLGKAGGTLPWESMRLVVRELQAQSPS